MKISIDGGEDQRWEVAGDERRIQRPEAAEQDTRIKGFEEIPESSPIGIYILTLSVWQSVTTRWYRDAESQVVTATQCDWKVLIGCTEIENLDQLSELGQTKMHREVLEV